jgi:hypothetical protein
MAQSQVPISTDSFTHKVTTPAWKTKPVKGGVKVSHGGGAKGDH